MSFVETAYQFVKTGGQVAYVCPCKNIVLCTTKEAFERLYPNELNRPELLSYEEALKVHEKLNN